MPVFDGDHGVASALLDADKLEIVDIADVSPRKRANTAFGGLAFFAFRRLAGELPHIARFRSRPGRRERFWGLEFLAS